jgi:hypothetical protein
MAPKAKLAGILKVKPGNFINNWPTDKSFSGEKLFIVKFSRLLDLLE